MWQSPLARKAALLNGLAVLVLIMGSLWLNQMRKGLVNARLDGLLTQAELVTAILADVATVGEPEPALEAERATLVLNRIPFSPKTTFRLFGGDGSLIASNTSISRHIHTHTLSDQLPGEDEKSSPPQYTPLTQSEFQLLYSGKPVIGERRSVNDTRLARVAIPVQRVKAVLGVLVLDATDIDDVIAAERKALYPFVIIAFLVLFISNAWLVGAILHPMIRLTLAADNVRSGRAMSLEIPKLDTRKDEIGKMARAFQSMTSSLVDRAEHSARFAGDVAHELKNPLASIQSAIESLSVVKQQKQKDQLTAIIHADVKRIDHMVSAILASSRLEAELATQPMQIINMNDLVSQVVAGYKHLDDVADVMVSCKLPNETTVHISGLPDSIGRTLRNLIDNARTFAPKGTQVAVNLTVEDNMAIIHVDDCGPGVATENQARIFERFYTDRPSNQKHTNHSGLGLAIAKHITEGCGGKIGVGNRLNDDGLVAGARFWLAFPLIKT